jgi:hypothetical protein
LSRVTLGKIVLTLVGLGLFLYGVRTDETAYRWAGIVLVALAFVARFLPGGSTRRR